MNSYLPELQSTIEKILMGPRGLLAADESFGTIGKR
jgi:fructose-bisphosphate aldolase class 1